MLKLPSSNIKGEENKPQQGGLQFKDNQLVFDNQLIYYFESFSTLKIDNLVGYDAIILDASDIDFAKIILKKFRSSYNPEFYLKPIFLINSKETSDPIIKHLNDGIIFSIDQIKEIINDVKQLFIRSTHLDNSPSNTYEVQIFKKVLNYLYTRELKTLHPVPDSSSSIGFTYPILSVNFDYFEESKVLEILSWAQREDLIWPDFIDRVYLCNNCGNGHLSYREICPFCDSANMHSEDLVHHFSCGYIGPISDYKNNVDSVLGCPKCSKALRHIGVDYDKPSIINHCNSCNNNFQDYLVKAKCMQCGSDAEVQFLVPKHINLYKLTKKGRNAAVTGLITREFHEVHDIFGTVSVQTFNTMMHYELERIKHTPGLSAHISVLYLDNIFDLLKKIGKTKEKTFINELVQIMRENITPADFITMHNPSIFYICINDVPLNDAKVHIDNIEAKIQKLIQNNFDKFNLHIHSRTVELNKNEAFDIQIKRITKELTEMHD